MAAALPCRSPLDRRPLGFIRLVSFFGLVVGVGLLLAACGGSNGDEATGSTDNDGGSAVAVEVAYERPDIVTPDACATPVASTAGDGGGDPDTNGTTDDPDADSVESAEGVASSESGDEVAPNIVLIMTDDQHWRSTDYMPIVRECLGGPGRTFTEAFVTSPNCCPARAGFLSGDYVADHGVYTNGSPRGGAAAFAPSGTFIEQLDDAGYRTGLFGKYLTNYQTSAHGDPAGFDEYLTFDDSPVDGSDTSRDTLNYLGWNGSDNGTPVSFGNDTDDYSTDVFGARAIEFIGEAAGPDPFFVQYSPFAPHRPATLPERHSNLADSYGRTTFPPNYGTAPSGQAWELQLSDAQWDNRQSEVEEVRGQQLASLQSVDDNVGMILDELAAVGELDNTVVLFTSDNGFAWGEHRWLHKLCPYDSCLRVPMIITDFRAVAASSASSVSDATEAADDGPMLDSRMVTNLDIAALLSRLGGGDPSSTMPNAEPFAIDPTMETSTASGSEQSGDGRTHFLIENYGAGNGASPLGLPAFQGVRTETHKYVRYPDGGEELFVLTTDPWELVNIAADPAQTDTLTELRDIVDDGFGRPLAQRKVELTVADGCLGDGDGMETEVDLDFPPSQDILSLQVTWQTDSSLPAETRVALDFVAEDVGWTENLQAALPARVAPDGTLYLPVNQGVMPKLDDATLRTLKITSAEEPEDTICATGPITMIVDYLATSS